MTREDEKRPESDKEQKSGFARIGAVPVIAGAAILVIAVLLAAQFVFNVSILNPSSADMAILARPVPTTIQSTFAVRDPVVKPAVSFRPPPTCSASQVLCSGMCTDTASDPANCGACAKTCTADHVCSSGACTCPAGKSDCAGTCRDLNQDAQNCGGCGRACPADRTCSGGACTCTNGRTDCGGTCLDLMVNGQNCGACGRACALDHTCSAGACTCPAGKSECGGLCTDLSTNAQNCGSCGMKCGTGQVCQAGACVCGPGYKECGGTCIPESQSGITCNGVCIDPKTDKNNCGVCGKVCASGLCGNGTCLAGCFVADTPVGTYDSLVPISTIREGDLIPGYDTGSGKVINRTVTEVLVHRDATVLRLEFTNDTVTCTPIQPFFTGVWTEAADLRAGDKVLCRDNHWEMLTADPVPAGTMDVYNLHGLPNQSWYTSYFVGRSQLLVHNMKVAR